jgi:hypothetical protein
VSIEQDNQYLQSTQESFFGCFAISYENHSDPIHGTYMLVLNGLRQIILATSFREYVYQMGGNKRVVKIEMSLKDGLNFNIGDTRIDTCEYWLTSINNVDLNLNKASTDWTEV